MVYPKETPPTHISTALTLGAIKSSGHAAAGSTHNTATQCTGSRTEPGETVTEGHNRHVSRANWASTTTPIIRQPSHHKPGNNKRELQKRQSPLNATLEPPISPQSLRNSTREILEKRFSKTAESRKYNSCPVGKSLNQGASFEDGNLPVLIPSSTRPHPFLNPSSNSINVGLPPLGELDLDKSLAVAGLHRRRPLWAFCSSGAFSCEPETKCRACDS